MKRHSLIYSLRVSALVVMGIGTAQAADFNLLTSPSLVGYVTFDEFLGNGDDQVFANTNLFGGASQFLDSAGNFGYLGGPAQSQGLTILGPQPRSVFGTNEYTSISTFGEWSSNVLGTFNNAFTQTLDVGAPSLFTIKQDQTYTSSFVLHDSAFGGRIAFTGSGRYLLNGQDPATLYTGDLLTHFNFVTPLLLNSWTSVAHETQTYEVLDGQFAGTTGGNTLTFFSTDFNAIPELPPQPLGSPWQTTGLAVISGDGLGISLGGTAVDSTATLAGGNTATVERLNLGGVGNGTLIVEGPGTELNRPGDRVGSVLKFGTGDATISVLDGGLLESGAILHLGQQGSRIQVLVSGAGSELSFASCAEAAGCGGLDFGFLGLVDVGSSSETSTTTVEQGARLEINARDNLSAGLNLQRNHVLTVDGPGSEVHVTGTQNGTSGAVRAGVGIEQTSGLHVTNGGKLAVVPMNIGTSGVFAGSQFVADTNKPAAKIVVDGTGSLIDAELFAIGERFVFDSVGQDFVEGGPGGLSEAIIRNGGLVKAERILIGESGVLKGSDGTLQGAVENRGTILPGESPGILNIVGDYTQTESGLLVIEIGGTAPGSFDVLNISGKATLDGTLKIELIDGFTPGATDTFEFLIASLFEGNFSAFDLPTFGANQTFAVNLGPGGFQASVSAVPVPAAGWLFGAALGALAYRRRGQEVPKNRS